MSRNNIEVALPSASSSPNLSEPKENISGPHRDPGNSFGSWIARAVLVTSVTALAVAWLPFGLSRWAAAGAGFLAALLLMLAELRMRRAEISGLVGGAMGTVVGILAALLVTLVISRTAEPEPTKSFLVYGSLLGFSYLGLLLGSSKGSELPIHAFPQAAPADVRASDGGAAGAKLLDTSVLIDGRIADICEAQFLDGVLQVPQFVLHELQQIADSSDTLRRQRGRRGLEVLQRMQKMPHLQMRVLEGDDDTP